jgi:hypothetical protein
MILPRFSTMHQHPMSLTELQIKSTDELALLAKGIDNYLRMNQGKFSYGVVSRRKTRDRIDRVLAKRGDEHILSPYTAHSKHAVESPEPCPDTHRLQVYTREHMWPADFISTWSTAELRRVSGELEKAEKQNLDNFSITRSLSKVTEEISQRLADPDREAKVVQEVPIFAFSDLASPASAAPSLHLPLSNLPLLNNPSTYLRLKKLFISDLQFQKYVFIPHLKRPTEFTSRVQKSTSTLRLAGSMLSCINSEIHGLCTPLHPQYEHTSIATVRPACVSSRRQSVVTQNIGRRMKKRK